MSIRACRPAETNNYRGIHGHATWFKARQIVPACSTSNIQFSFSVSSCPHLTMPYLTSVMDSSRPQRYSPFLRPSSDCRLCTSQAAMALVLTHHYRSLNAGMIVSLDHQAEYS